MLYLEPAGSRTVSVSGFAFRTRSRGSPGPAAGEEPTHHFRPPAPPPTAAAWGRGGIGRSGTSLRPRLRKGPEEEEEEGQQSAPSTKGRRRWRM